MLKMYMQLFLTLGSFFSMVLSAVWLLMTYIYASRIMVERGVEPVYNWLLIIAVVVILLLSVAAFIVGVVWVKRVRAGQREKILRWRSLSLRKKEQSTVTS